VRAAVIQAHWPYTVGNPQEEEPGKLGMGISPESITNAGWGGGEEQDRPQVWHRKKGFLSCCMKRHWGLRRKTPSTWRRGVSAGGLKIGGEVVWETEI